MSQLKCQYDRGFYQAKMGTEDNNCSDLETHQTCLQEFIIPKIILLMTWRMGRNKLVNACEQKKIKHLFCISHTICTKQLIRGSSFFRNILEKKLKTKLWNQKKQLPFCNPCRNRSCNGASATANIAHEQTEDSQTFCVIQWACALLYMKYP